MNENSNTLDTIAAIATPPGTGGVGIIRISGSIAVSIAQQITQHSFLPRQAVYCSFIDEKNLSIDSGILLYFPNPNSYTGEDVIELQGHGGRVVMDMLLKRVIELGARIANPGEFTERAFLNNKINLAQAEAVADLIESSTVQSVRSAQRSLQGTFSNKIDDLVDQLTELRIFVEAAIDFVDEEIDFLSDGVVANKIQGISKQINSIMKTAQQGRLLRDGMTVVLAGKPNAGKSSLLNALAGHEAAIVTDIAGTTRDVLKEQIQLDGLPLHIIDTAGIRETESDLEKEGIKRAQQQINQADIVLLLIDSNQPEDLYVLDHIPEHIPVCKVYNKIDLSQKPADMIEKAGEVSLYISAKKQLGMDLLVDYLKKAIGYNEQTEDVFIARRRHIQALESAHISVVSAEAQLEVEGFELVAEELKQAQNSLAEITGEVSSDELLGKIFSSFCIGK